MVKMKYLLIIISVLFCFGMKAQTANINSVEQKGQKIYITYDLKGNPGKYNIKLFVKSKNSYSWSSALKSVSGNVGANQTVGINKQIVWDVLRDRDKFEGVWIFGIEAVNYSEEKKSKKKELKEDKWKYFFLSGNTKSKSHQISFDANSIFSYYNFNLTNEPKIYFAFKYGGGNYKFPFDLLYPNQYSIGSGNLQYSRFLRYEFAESNIAFSLGKSKK